MPTKIVTHSLVLALTLGILACTGTNSGRENVSEYIDGFAPKAIAYPSESMVLLQNLPLTPIVPTISAKKAIDQCTVSPALPAGLSLDSATCAISGSPASQQTANVYTVTAANAIGSKSQSISIAVTASVLVSCQSNSGDSVFTSAKCTDGLAFTNETGTNTTLSFTARLSTQPLSNVTLTVATTDASEARLATTGGNCDNASSTSASQCSITFTTTNWNVDQTIKIIAFNDFVSHESPAPTYSITIAGTALFENITSNQMPNRLTFVTTNTSTGNLGGVAGADSFCMNDPGHPDAALPLGSRRSFKAFITTTGGSVRQWDRPASTGTAGRIDWIMEANTNYFRINGTTLIATTGADQRFSAMSNSVDGTTNESWLGFLAGGNWTAYILSCGAPCPLNTGSCLNFTSSSSAESMRTLIQNTTAMSSLSSSGAVRTCDVPRRLWCIQQ
ncbi:MAG: DUF1554 domain-containing protein [Leptospiraceae bacterium]|nr:DUF1554 domain-containing protein [Leptospiraceae bacterium]